MRFQSSDEAIEAAFQRATNLDLTPYFRLQWLWYRTRVSAAAAEHFPTDIPEPTYGRALVNWEQASPGQRSKWLPTTVHSEVEFRLTELAEEHGWGAVLPDPDGEEQAEEARLEAQHQRELLAEFHAAGRASITIPWRC